jgi:glycosyltransferase 2 family protein
MHRATAWALTASKLAVSAALLVYVVRGIDSSLFSGLAQSLRAHITIMALTLFGGMFILGAVRWQRLTAVAGSRIPFHDALSLTWIGHFFNQLLPTSIGGDAVRAWYARNANTDLTRAAAVVLCDRAVGVCALALIIGLLLPAIWQPSERSDQGLVLAIAVGCLFGTAVFVAALPLFARHRRLFLLECCARLLLNVLDDRRAATWLLGTALLSHLCCALIGYLLIASFWPDAPLMECGVLFLTALLVSMVPVSYAGWGLREASAVYFLRDAGVDPGIAFTTSVSFGVLLAISSLPGAIFWAARRSRAIP